MISLFSTIPGSISGQATLPQQSPITNPPIVTNLSIPSYPSLAHTANVSGVVKIRVTTDGNRAISFDQETGPPLLLRPTEENLRTWEFQGDNPTTFIVTFDYQLQEGEACSMAPAIPILQLPSKVVIIADHFEFCDPPGTIGKRHWWQFWK